MQVLRLSTPILRSSTRAMTMRMYSPGPEGKAGSVAGSKTWNTREKAVEDQYIIQHEREKLKKRAFVCRADQSASSSSSRARRSTTSRRSRLAM